MKNILILCTGNSCRSVLAEGLLNHHGEGRFKAFSAGSHPSGTVHPMSLYTLKANGISTEGYRSKSWDEFAAQPFDALITVCDNAAGETCPVFFGAPVKAHWGVEDPAHFQGTDSQIKAEFQRVFDVLSMRVKAMIALPDNLDQATLATKLNEIGKLCPPSLGFFERFLTIWVGLCIGAGVLVGYLLPNVFQFIASLEYAHVNFVVASLIWVMIYPMMVNVDFSTIKDVGKNPKGLVITFIVNWLIKPFSMAGLAVLFLRHIFVEFIPSEDAKQYVAGLILLGTAPCTAMVFVWSRLVKGNANYTLVQVSLNDLVMILAYAPVVAFLLGVSNITVPWATLLLSVGLYVIIPITAGYITRRRLSLTKLPFVLEHLRPYSVIGLLITVVLLFGFQAQTLLDKPIVVLLIAVPILLQSVLMFLLTYIWLCKVRVRHDIAAPAALIGASNFFELAVAVAISLFGLKSGAALATVVGVLVEVPAMLCLVSIANKCANKFRPESSSPVNL